MACPGETEPPNGGSDTMTWGQAIFWATALIGHGFLWVEVVNRLHGLGWPRRLIDNVTSACGLLVSCLPVAIAWSLLASSPTQGSPAWATGYAWIAQATLACVVLSRIGLRWDPTLDRRSRLTEQRTLDLEAQLGDDATGDDRVRRLARLPGNQVLRVSVEHLEVPLDRLPAELEGLRIAHLTDLHMSGRLALAYFQEVVRAVNEWQPDLICVTGDIVEYAPQLDWVAPTLGELRPRLGAYFVLGNHDAKVDCQELRQRLAQAGLTDVGSQVVEAEYQGTTFRLCGDERPWFSDGPTLTESKAFTLCLTHTPDRFGWAIEHRVDLALAGHTHGGQVCFPLLGPLLCPSRHGVRYASGTFRRRGTVMHVGRGTGSLFPLRYNCPPEVALLTLTQS